MRYLDVGGGLGIDYDGSKTSYTGIASSIQSTVVLLICFLSFFNNFFFIFFCFFCFFVFISTASINYTIDEYAADVIISIKDVCDRHKLQVPVIISGILKMVIL